MLSRLLSKLGEILRDQSFSQLLVKEVLINSIDLKRAVSVCLTLHMGLVLISVRLHPLIKLNELFLVRRRG